MKKLRQTSCHSLLKVTSEDIALIKNALIIYWKQNNKFLKLVSENAKTASDLEEATDCIKQLNDQIDKMLDVLEGKDENEKDSR